MEEKTHSNKCKTNDHNVVLGHTIPRECDCDGYHTFKDLYNHRYALFINLCRLYNILRLSAENINMDIGIRKVWKSKLHSDGTMFDDSFIMGIGEEPGKQITYHFPLEMFEKMTFAETLENAPEWDGHTPDDVLERLKSL